MFINGTRLKLLHITVIGVVIYWNSDQSVASSNQSVATLYKVQTTLPRHCTFATCTVALRFFFLFITFKHHISSMLQNILVFKVFQQHNLDLAYFPSQQEHPFPYFACYLIPQTIFESLHLYHCHSLRKHCKCNRTKFCSDASFQPIWNKHFSCTAL